MIDHSSRPYPLVARFFLGLCVIWQILFLFSSNLLSLAAKARDYWQDQNLVKTIAPNWSQAKGPIADTEHSLSTMTMRWSELTGQPQNWSLFAPNVTSVIPFVAVEFCWDEDPGSRDDRSEIQKLERRLTDLLKTGDVRAPPSAPWRHQAQASVVLLSANEPSEAGRYAKFGRFRLRRYESNIDVSLA